jgi:transcriptional regulator with XRE-family HTH domain
MIEITSTKWVSMTDIAIIKAVGAYIRHQRLEQNKTQAQVAEEAGINRWTLSQIENGESITLVTLIRILRVLDLLHLLEVFTIEEKISPIEYARLKEKRRKRARPKKNSEPKSDGDLGW